MEKPKIAIVKITRKPNFDARENQRMRDLMAEIIRDQEINKQILKDVKKSNV